MKALRDMLDAGVIWGGIALLACTALFLRGCV